MKKIYSLILLSIILLSCNTNNKVSPRFNHVLIQVSNMEKSVDFYTQAFNLKVTNSIKQLVITLPDGTKKERDVNIVLLKFPNQDFVYEMLEVAKSDSLVDFALYRHVGIDVENIEEAFERATNAGAKTLVPIRLVQANEIEVKQAFLNGPDGEIIELMQIISGEF